MVENQVGEFYYPNLAQAFDRKIWLTYTYNRKSIGYAVFDLDWLLEK